MNQFFSARLSELRRERGVSQKEAAADLGISQALLSHYEKGIRECGLDFVVRAADFYGVTCDYLLGRSASRVGLEGTYAIEDLPEDEHMCMSTVYRAAAVVLENMTIEGSEPLQSRSRWFFCLAVFRTLVSAAMSGIAPRDWFTIEPRVSGPAAAIMMESIERTLYDTDHLTGKTRGSGEPVCVRTVIRETEHYIRAHVDRFFPPRPIEPVDEYLHL